MVKRLIIAASVSLAVIGVAVAQQWPNVPIVGGASYCSATGNAGVCTNTVPAGPALTGNETIPVDTNLAAGQNPQTAKVDINSLGLGTYQYAAPLTGATLTVTPQQNQLIVDPGGTIAALTVNLPAASVLVDNQRWGICSTQIITALTISSGTGTTVTNNVTALGVPVTVAPAVSCPEWLYKQNSATAGTWYRVH